MRRRSFAAIGLAGLLPTTALGSSGESKDEKGFLSIDFRGLKKHKFAMVLKSSGSEPREFTIETSEDGTLTIRDSTGKGDSWIKCNHFSIQPTVGSIEINATGKAESDTSKSIPSPKK